MTIWHDPRWRMHRPLAEEMDSHSASTPDDIPEAVLNGLAASQWVHALLRTRWELSDGTDQREARVEEMMERIKADAKHPALRSTNRRRYFRWGTIAVAATLLFALFVLNWEHAPDAVAQVRRTQTAMRDDMARRYHVKIEMASLLRRRAIDGTLTVRGAHRFVFECRLPVGGKLLLGADGKTGWGIPPGGPVVVSPDPDRMQRWAERYPSAVSPQILHIDTLLSRMASDYQLTSVSPTEKGRIAIRGTKQSEAPVRLPHEVSLVADANTGVIQTLTMRWEGPSMLPLPQRITLQFQQSVHVDDDWFEHEAHHDPSRPVVDLTKQRAAPAPQQ